MVSANPRDIGNIYRPRTQEFTGGYNPREVLDLQINPNDDDDGLSHNSRNTTEDSESRDQRDPKKRREKALRELAPALQHISIKPQEMDDAVLRSPRFEEENKLLESRLGVDLGARGLSLAAGANRGPARSDTPYVTYGRDNSLGAFGKSVNPFLMDEESVPDQCEIRISPYCTEAVDFYVDDIQRGAYICGECAEYYGGLGDLHYLPNKDIEKAKRKYRGRKYSEDEESDEEEKKSKRSNKRKKKRSGRKGKKKAGGKLRFSQSRDVRRITPTRGAAVRHLVDRDSKNQKFGRALSRRFGLGSSTELPLRLRDPIAYARKLANEKVRRQTGALPRQFTAHRSASAGVSEGATRGGLIGGTKGGAGRAARMAAGNPTSMRSGATMDRLLAGAIGDPLGTADPLVAKMKPGSLSRTEIIALKKKIEALLRKLNKLAKATPEHEENAKRGATASENVASAPQGGTKRLDPWMFEDTSINTVVGVVGKK